MDSSNTPGEADSKSPNPDSPDGKYLGDLQKTQILQQLFTISRENRDATWQASLLNAVGEASFACGDPQVIQGPDGFPYFRLLMPEAGKPFTCYVIKNMKDDFLLTQGFGVVLFSNNSENPDWVFSYGDILNYHANNEFYSAKSDWYVSKESGTVVMKEQEQVMAGQPSERILPNETRALINSFLQSNDIQDNKVLLMMRRKPDGTTRELVFNLTPGKCKSHDHFNSILRTISWYLPRHYSFSSMAESSMGNSFQPL